MAGGYPTKSPAHYTRFASRRSVVHSTEGMIACSQPLAAACGLKILARGGNAADAAVAVAAGLNLTEPHSTGIGGDIFALFYDAKTKKVSALNGSGRAPQANTLDSVRKDLRLKPEDSGAKIPMDHIHAVTVPGAAAGWCDTVERFGSGKLSMEEVLGPAIEMGERGFPVCEVASSFWQSTEAKLKAASPNFAEMLKSDPDSEKGCRAPRPGELFKNPNLANTFRTLAKEGKKGFYTGHIGSAIVEACSARGGKLALEDLEKHLELGSESVDPISLPFQTYGEGLEVWEHPPNGQGIVALMALGMLEHLTAEGKIPRFEAKDHNTAPYIHAIVEVLRIAFADASWWVADPSTSKVPTKEMISKDYLAERAKIFDYSKPSECSTHGSPAMNSSDTVYFAVTDKQGNAISFINSNYSAFGTGIIPQGCGFTMQCRGANFSLDAEHPNAYAGGKRPYHTIIPALTTNLKDGSLHSVFGVMGGFMQPQGHVQVLMNQLAFGMDPQQALDAPRVCIGAGMPDQSGKVLDMTVNLEEGISEAVRDELIAMGHQAVIVPKMTSELFGRGQIIRKVDHGEDGSVYSAGSDHRGDGAAFPAL